MGNQGDIRMVYNVRQGYGDLVIDDRDLERDDGLETAILISLATNRRADNEDVLPDNAGSHQGWWADKADPGNPNPDLIGSRLWLLGREKFADNLPARVEEFSEEALQWMIEDAVAKDIQITASRSGSYEILIEISIIRPSAVTATFFRYFYNWKNQITRSG